MDCGEWAIRTAFKKEGFVRCVSRKKPPLSKENRKKRLEWALEHVNWTDEQWDESPIFISDQAPLAMVSMPNIPSHPFEARMERKSKRKAGVGAGVA